MTPKKTNTKSLESWIWDAACSPSRYIHTSDAETYRPLAEIVADLDTVEGEMRDAEPLGLDCKRFINSKKNLRLSASSAVHTNSKGFPR